MKRVLSIDGGGMRGVVPLGVLSVIEDRVGPLHQHFDMVFGTSTGGVIACGLGLGMSVDEVASIYFEDAKNIFRKKRRFPRTLWQPQYRARDLQRVLRKHLGDKLLAQMRTKIAVTTYRIREGDGRATFWKSWQHQGVPVVDAIQCTGQAPTAHPLHQYLGDQYTDGGVFARDPSAFAYAEARRLYDEPVYLISLGTSQQAKRLGIKTHAGLVDWGKSILDVLLDSQDETAAYVVQALLHERDKFLRINGVRAGVRVDTTDEDELRAAFERARSAAQMDERLAAYFTDHMKMPTPSRLRSLSTE